MDCKRYKRWLGDAALEALDHSREAELRAHLAICSECSADLERERRLLAAIDRVIDEGQKAGPSPQFAPRVWRRVAEEAARPRRAFARWISVTTGAIAAVALMAVWLVYRTAVRRAPPVSQTVVRTNAARDQQHLTSRNQVSGQKVQPLVIPKSLAEPEARPPDGSAGDFASLRRPIKRISPRKVAATSAEPQVLVERDQWASVMRLYHAIRHGRVDTSSLLAEAPGFARQADGSVVPVPLKIPPLEVAKLDLDSKPAPSSFPENMFER